MLKKPIPPAALAAVVAVLVAIVAFAVWRSSNDTWAVKHGPLPPLVGPPRGPEPPANFAKMSPEERQQWLGQVQRTAGELRRKQLGLDH